MSETDNNIKNKPLWVIILISGAVMIVASFIFLFSSLTSSNTTTVSTPTHQNLMNSVTASIDETKQNGIAEITTEDFVNKDGDKGVIRTYKYYNPETQKGLSCINDCSISSQEETLDSSSSWLKIILLNKTHTRTIINQIDENTYEVKYLDNDTQPEIWTVSNGLVTNIKTSTKNENIESTINTQITYGLNAEAKLQTR